MIKDATAEQIAKAFHDAYESKASSHNYETRKESAVAWENVPENNKSLMIAVVAQLLEDGVISA